MKFPWTKDTSKDETELSFKTEDCTGGVASTKYFYVKAQTSTKALELYDKLKERENPKTR